MKRHAYLLPSLLVFLSILTISCKAQSSDAPMPDLGIPEEEVNKRFLLEAPKGWNSFKIGDIISLNVDVISNDQIAFQSDYGAKIFALEDNKWIEVANLMKYPEGYILLSKSIGEPFQQGEADLDPILQDTNKSIMLRIILIGNIYQDGQVTDKQTSAYIDVHLKP